MAAEADPFALERAVKIYLGRDFTGLIRDKGPSLALPLVVLHGGFTAANLMDAGPGPLQEHIPATAIK